MKAKNQKKWLEGRIMDWSRTINDNHPGAPKISARCGSGGYHKPGSNKK